MSTGAAGGSSRTESSSRTRPGDFHDRRGRSVVSPDQVRGPGGGRPRGLAHPGRDGERALVGRNELPHAKPDPGVRGRREDPRGRANVQRPARPRVTTRRGCRRPGGRVTGSPKCAGAPASALALRNRDRAARVEAAADRNGDGSASPLQDLGPGTVRAGRASEPPKGAPSCTGAGGFVDDLLRGTLLDDPPQVHDCDPVREMGGGREIVRDHQDPEPLLSSPSSRCRTPARTETSSIDTGSSARRSLGSSTRLAAIATRWRWPPESSCGNRSM